MKPRIKTRASLPTPKKSYAAIVEGEGESTLENQFLNLQQENRELKHRLLELEARVEKLEKTEKTGKDQIVNEVIEMCNSAPPPQLVASVNNLISFQVDEAQEKMKGDIKTKVDVQMQAEFKEQQERQVNSVKIRMGGMPENFYNTDKSFEEVFKDVEKYTPGIEWNIYTWQAYGWRGNHIQITFREKEDRLEILRQANKLKGTKIWISEELTRNQLKERTRELVKVRVARKEGKWAVYRDGRALVRDFKSIKSTKDSQSITDVKR